MHLLCLVIGLASADEFFATIKKVDGSKVTINKSKKDEKKEDETLTAIEKVKVQVGKAKFDKDTKKFGDFEGKVVEDGLKSDMFSKEVRALITTNEKKEITEIKVLKKKKE